MKNHRYFEKVDYPTKGTSSNPSSTLRRKENLWDKPVRELQKNFQNHFFECEDNLEVAQALIGKVEEFSRHQKCNEIVGNFNLTAMQMAGVVTKINLNYHYTDQVFSPLYVAELLHKCGYEQFFPMSTHEVDDSASLVCPA